MQFEYFTIGPHEKWMWWLRAGDRIVCKAMKASATRDQCLAEIELVRDRTRSR